MRAKITYFLAIVLVMASMLLAGCPPVPLPKGPDVPPNLLVIAPPEDTVFFADQPRDVCVTFDFHAGAGIENPEEQIHFYINGQEITDLRWNILYNWYDDHKATDRHPDGSLCYPEEGAYTFPIGEYTLEILYTDRAGEEFSYAWHYTVKTP
jgi:hypothetical protein